MRGLALSTRGTMSERPEATACDPKRALDRDPRAKTAPIHQRRRTPAVTLLLSPTSRRVLPARHPSAPQACMHAREGRGGDGVPGHGTSPHPAHPSCRPESRRARGSRNPPVHNLSMRGCHLPLNGRLSLHGFKSPFPRSIRIQRRFTLHLPHSLVLLPNARLCRVKPKVASGTALHSLRRPSRSMLK